MHSACIDVENDPQDITREAEENSMENDADTKLSPPKKLVSLDKSGDLSKSPKANAQRKPKVEKVMSNSLIDQKVTENSERSREDGASTNVNPNAASVYQGKASTMLHHSSDATSRPRLSSHGNTYSKGRHNYLNKKQEF